MRPVIGGKRKNLAGYDRRETFSGLAEAGKALRADGGAAEPEQESAANESAARYRQTTAHRRRS
jgi:hypothetical protein